MVHEHGVAVAVGVTQQTRAVGRAAKHKVGLGGQHVVGTDKGKRDRMVGQLRSLDGNGWLIAFIGVAAR